MAAKGRHRCDTWIWFERILSSAKFYQKTTFSNLISDSFSKNSIKFQFKNGGLSKVLLASLFTKTCVCCDENGVWVEEEDEKL